MPYALPLVPSQRLVERRTSPPGSCTQSQHLVTCVSGLDAACSQNALLCDALSAHSRRHTYDASVLCCGKTRQLRARRGHIYTALYCTVSGQLQYTLALLYNVLAARQIFRLMLKKHRNHSADAGPSWVCLPPWLPARRPNQISIVSLAPRPLPSLTHGFPVPSPPPRKTGRLVRFWACHPSTAAIDLSIRIFCCPLLDQGFLSRTGTCKIAQKPPLVRSRCTIPSVCAPHLAFALSCFFSFHPRPLIVSHCPPPQF
ncbi:hypothetical protein GGI35DRAFT_96097 [Trichoderma velutinum]